MDKDDIDRTWNYWASKIKEAMNKHILYTFTASQPFFAMSLKATKLHSALKNINKCLQQLSNKAADTITQANQYLTKAATLAEININPITQEEFAHSQLNTIDRVKQHKHTIWQARNYEKKQEQTECIKFYINRRYTDFKDNTS